MWNKSLLYRESTAVPMVLAGPGVAQRRCDTPCTLVDVFPTVLDALGVAPHAQDQALPGRSLLGFTETDAPGRVAFSEYHAVGSPSGAYLLADSRYTYHHYVGFEPELFDLDTDPAQAVNLAADPRHAATVAHFERQLRDRLDPEAVDRRAKQDQNALVARFGGRDSALRSGTPGATPVLESEP
jgi:choline-sulfatase